MQADISGDYRGNICGYGLFSYAFAVGVLSVVLMTDMH